MNGFLINHQVRGTLDSNAHYHFSTLVIWMSTKKSTFSFGSLNLAQSRPKHLLFFGTHSFHSHSIVDYARTNNELN